MKSTSHFGENDADEPGFVGKDDACRRGALESGTTPHVAGGSRRARPAAPTAPAQSGGRTSPRVVQISSNLSDPCSLAPLADRWRCRCDGEADACTAPSWTGLSRLAEPGREASPPGSIMIGRRLAQLRLLMFEPLWFDAYGDDPSRTWLLLYRLSKDWTSEFRERATREQFE